MKNTGLAEKVYFTTKYSNTLYLQIEELTKSSFES
jgi:hypothetical protein